MPRKAQQDDDLVMSLVEMALASPPDQRRACLDSACAGDTELLETVWKYIQSEERMAGFLRDPLYRPFAAERAFEPGDLLDGRFRIVREIARGGMGIVYEATDERLERRIALKCAKAGHRKRLPPEVRNASEISHPNVCKIYEIHTASTTQGDIDFLTMEYLDGETLAARLRRGPLPGSEAAEIALQICAGLAEAHRHHVIHGDLKSNNIIVTREESGSTRAVITDFGLARKPGAQLSSRLTGQLAGTPDYMAPELWMGHKPSVSSDIYALGVILREMTAGRSAWRRVVRRCLEDDPARRYGSVQEVAAAIAPRSRRWFAAVAAAAALAVASGLATYRFVTAPAEHVRLAAFPLIATPETASSGEDLGRSVVDRLARIRSSARTRFSVASDAAVASHTLTMNIRRENGALLLQAILHAARSQDSVREWTGMYSPAELAYAPAAISGLVTGTFHLPPLAEDARVNAAALQDYKGGLQLLRTSTGIDAGVAMLERAVQSDPASPLTHAGLAEALWWKYKATNDRSVRLRTVDELACAERRHLDLPEVYRVAGLLKFDAGRYEQAESDYVRSIELDPANGDAFRRLAMVFDAMNERDKALAAYRRAVELDPGHYRNHQALGNHYRERGDYVEAAKHFSKAVDTAPGEPAAHAALGSAYMSMGRFADAERALRASLQLAETPASLNTLGAILFYQSRDAEAAGYIERALSRWPERYLWWMNLGTAYRRLHRNADAERANRRAMELIEPEMAKNPRNGHARACLAYVAAWLGDRRRAESEIAQALQFAPQDADVRRIAVKTYEALGRRQEALSVLAASLPNVIVDVGRYPDLADLHRDSRFLDLLASSQSK